MGTNDDHSFTTECPTEPRTGETGSYSSRRSLKNALRRHKYKYADMVRASAAQETQTLAPTGGSREVKIGVRTTPSTGRSLFASTMLVSLGKLDRIFRSKFLGYTRLRNTYATSTVYERN